MPSEPRKRRFGFRISVRALIVLVLLIGGGLGWIVHRAKVQRDAVAAIHRAKGFALYDVGDTDFQGPLGGGRWWLVKSLGEDYFYNVTAVGFHGPAATDEVLAQLKGLNRLETLGISEARTITAAGMDSIGELSPLKYLAIDRPGWVDADLAPLSGLNQLVSIRLTLDSTSKITDAGVANLAPLRNLQSLQIDGTQVTTKGLESFRGIENLGILSLRNARITSLEPLAGLKQLTSVDVRGNPIDDDGLKACAGWPRVRDLYLSGDLMLTDAGLVHLGQLSSLRNLDLQWTNIGDAGAARLAACPSLGQLNLSGTKVGDDGIEALAKRTSTLSLILDKTQFTERGAALMKRPGSRLIWSPR